MSNFVNIKHADWQQAFESGMRSAGTFRAQSNMVIMGAVALFWANSKNIAYLNSALQYAAAYRGIRVEAVKGFLVYFTGAKYDRDNGKFSKGGKKAAMPAEFLDLQSWVDWANDKAPERKFDAVSDEKAIIKTLERKIDSARDALQKVRAAEEPDQDAENMILEHIAKTEQLKTAAEQLYN